MVVMKEYLSLNFYGWGVAAKMRCESLMNIFTRKLLPFFPSYVLNEAVVERINVECCWLV